MVLFLCSCSQKDIVKVPAKITIENADEMGAYTLAFKNRASSQSFNFKADGEWFIRIPEGADWFSVEPTSGRAENETVTVKVNVEENATYEAKSATLAFVCDKLEQKALLYITQESMTKLVLNASELSVFTDGGSIDLSVETTNVPDWTANSSVEWATAKKNHLGSVNIVFAKNTTGAERSGKVTLVSSNDSELSAEVSFTQSALQAVKPDVFDISFNVDGSATDACGHPVLYTAGNGTSTTFNSSLGLYSTTYNMEMGGSNKIDNGSALTGVLHSVKYDDAITGTLADGFSLEAIMTIGKEPNGSETKFLSSTQGGGTALMVGNTGRGKEIEFIYNASATGSSSWHFCKSGIVPEAGRQYHVVGVWDQAKGVSYIYVDGKLCGTLEDGDKAPLVYRQQQLATKYFCIGGNINNANGQSFNGLWNGSVVVAKMYGNPISAEQVAAAYASTPAIKIIK